MPVSSPLSLSVPVVPTSSPVTVEALSLPVPLDPSVVPVPVVVEPVASVEYPGVVGRHRLERPGEAALRTPDHQVEVVRHEAVGRDVDRLRSCGVAGW